MASRRKINRRSFLKEAAVAAGAAVAVPAIVPSSALGKDGSVAPSERIVMCALGVGSMGTGDMRGFMAMTGVQMVAVCDVDKRHRRQAQKLVNDRYKSKGCKAYLDYREMIARDDLDAMMHALPDHWHALPTVAAAKAGLDIHGQKPFARSIREGRAMVDAVERYGRIWQTGSQQRSEGRFRFACELVRNGRIGKVHRVEVGLPSGGGGGNTRPTPIPGDLDWNFWLGPAPDRAYCWGEKGPHWNWRWVMDYSGGQLTDWCGHHVDIAHWGLGYDTTGPVEIAGKGEYPTEGLYDAATAYEFTCKYASGVEIRVTNNRINPQGTKWIGDKGWVFVKRGRIDASPKSLLNEVIGPDEIKLYDSGGHKQNFIRCIRTRKPTICPAEVGHRSISVGLLGEIAMLTGRSIRWNPETEEIIGDPAASRLLNRSYRQPWHL